MIRQFNALKAEYDVIVFAIRQRVYSAPSGVEETPPPVQIRRVVAEEDDALVDETALYDKATTITHEQIEETPQPRIRRFPVKVPEVAKQPSSIRVRKVAGDTASTANAVKERLRITENDVSWLTEEEIEPVTQNSLTQVTSAADESTRHIETLQEEFELVLGSILLRNVTSPIIHQISNIQTTVDTLRRETARMLRWINLRAHIVHAVNRSALVVYGLNISLRWRLGHMIRNRLPYRHALRPEIHRLESRIFVLRDCRRILLCNRPRLTEQAVREWLEAMEMRSRVQKRLAPKMDEKTREIRRQYHGAKARRQALRNEPIAAGSRVRMTSKSLLVRKRIPRSRDIVSRKEDSMQPTGNRVYKAGLPRPPGAPRKLPRVNSKNPGTTRATWRAERKQRRDEFAARVSSWLAGDFRPVKDDSASTDKT